MQEPTKKKSKTVWIIVIVAGLALCVPCTGILAAMGIPAFVGYTRRSKTAEATSMLSSLFRGAASYYNEERSGPAGILTHCTVDSATTPNAPGRTRTLLGPLPPSFEALTFPGSDPVYYRYEIVSAGGCNHSTNETLYTFRARGDLDGDGEQSLFELSAGTDNNNELFHPPDFHRENETE